jgi:hypothetical protein
MSQTIQARVSGKILQKADRLFNNSLSQVFVELLQNARRAGASLVTVTTTVIAPAITGITFTDNGSGIADFQQLLSLGDSGWEKEVEEHEDPAGMGLFCLVHTGVTILSRGKEVTISPAAFLGKEAVEVVDQKAASAEVGTTLIFTRSANVTEIAHTLGRVVKFGPTAVILNGNEIAREDFLADAAEITEFEGVRIGVFAKHSGNSSNDNVNFHGMVIRGPWEASLGAVLLDGSGNPLDVYARVDVVSTSGLHLKLPDRVSVVQDEACKRVSEAIERAMYRYVASRGRHIASFDQYTRAKGLGVDIGEALPYLGQWYARARDSDRSEPFEDDREQIQRTVVEASKVVFVDEIGDTSLPESFAFQNALKTHELPLGLIPVNRNEQLKGYSWYAAIPVITDFKLIVDGKPAEDAYPQCLAIVKEIGLSFSFINNSGSKAIEWNDLLVAVWGTENWDDDFTILIAETSPWATTRSLDEPFSLVSTATYVGFSYNDSGEGDSYDTQEEYFRNQAELSMTEILGGALQAAERSILGALDWNVRQALDKANLVEIRLIRDEKGSWRTDIPVSA